VKFVLFVEGKTEYLGVGNFLKRWLDARLPQRVRVTPVKFNGVSDYYGDIVKNARLHLSSVRANDVIAGVGLLDLYGLDSALTFPPGIVSPQQRWVWAKRDLETRVDHPKFRQYFAVHETEAWLLSDTEIFLPEMRNDLRAASNAPEQVDFNNPPARLLMRVYRDRLRRRYQKAVDGPSLFRLLEPDRACAKCPYLRTMLEDMLALANQALA
jgi:hypothetical protein